MIEGDKLVINVLDRSKVIKRGIDLFKSTRGNFQLIENAHVKIAGVYFTILEENVRPLVPKNINKFKIAAITAMTIVKLQPILSKDNVVLNAKEKRIENGRLGYFVGISIMLDMIIPETELSKSTGILLIDESMRVIQRQHIKWLQLKKLDDFPVFPVSAFYYIFFTMFQTKYAAQLT